MPRTTRTDAPPAGLDQPAAIDPAYLERSFDSLVAALDTLPVEAEKDYLARLVLILAEELKDAGRFEAAVVRAMPRPSSKDTPAHSGASATAAEDLARGGASGDAREKGQ